MIVKDAFDQALQRIKQKDFTSPRLDTELVLAHVLKTSREGLQLRFGDELNPMEHTEVEKAVERRVSGEPIAYILGHREFFDLDFEVGPGVLVPRPETEHLVEIVLQNVNTRLKDFVEFGVGSGCISLSLLKHLPEARAWSFEISPDALSFARRNAEKLGMSDRIHLFQDSVQTLRWPVSSGAPSNVSLVVANPPYIDKEDQSLDSEVKKFEPAIALFADDHGLSEIKHWAHSASELLRPGGLYVFELGADQGVDVYHYLRTMKSDPELSEIFDDVQIFQDLAGRDRICLARKAQWSEAEELRNG